MLRLDCFLEEKHIEKLGFMKPGFTLVYVETHYKTSFVRGYDISHLRVVEYCNQFDPWHIPFLVGFQDKKKHTISGFWTEKHGTYRRVKRNVPGEVAGLMVFSWKWNMQKDAKICIDEQIFGYELF